MVLDRRLSESEYSMNEEGGGHGVARPRPITSMQGRNIYETKEASRQNKKQRKEASQQNKKQRKEAAAKKQREKKPTTSTSTSSSSRDAGRAACKSSGRKRQAGPARCSE
jgi:hypothetical protein